MVQLFPTSTLASVNCFRNPINDNSWKRFVNTTVWMWPVIFHGSCVAPAQWVPWGNIQFSFSVEIFKCPFLLLRKEMGGGGGGGVSKYGLIKRYLGTLLVLCFVWFLFSHILYLDSFIVFYRFCLFFGWCKTRSQHGTNLYISKEEFQWWLAVQ